MITLMIFNLICLAKGTEVFTSTDLVPKAITTVRISGNATLNPSSAAALSEILHTLESIKELRMREFQDLKLKENKTNNNSVSNYIKSIDRDMEEMIPVKKTYGYKVTVYKQPFGEEKPVVYKHDIEVDENTDPEPLEDLIHSESKTSHKVIPTSKSSSVLNKYNKEQHLRQTAVRDKEREGYSNKKRNKLHKVTDIKENKDIKEHEKEAGSEQAVREKTEIEYYEKERFIDTELPHSEDHRASPVMETYTSSQPLSTQHSFPQVIYDMPTATTDNSYISLLPYSYYRNAVITPGGELIKSPSQTYQPHSYDNPPRPSSLHHHMHPTNSLSDKTNGHVWEGFRERGYKISSQREFVVKDRYKNKKYGRTEAAEKKFKSSHVISKDEDDHKEHSYSRYVKDSTSHTTGYKSEKHKKPKQGGKDLLDSSNKHLETVTQPKNSSSVQKHGTRSKNSRKIKEKSRKGNETLTRRGSTGQPSIAEIIKVSIQEAVNRSRNSIKRKENSTSDSENHSFTENNNKNGDKGLMIVFKSRSNRNNTKSPTVIRNLYNYTIGERRSNNQTKSTDYPTKKHRNVEHVAISSSKPKNSARQRPRMSSSERFHTSSETFHHPLNHRTLDSSIAVPINHPRKIIEIQKKQASLVNEKISPLRYVIDRNIKVINDDDFRKTELHKHSPNITQSADHPVLLYGKEENNPNVWFMPPPIRLT